MVSRVGVCYHYYLDEDQLSNHRLHLITCFGLCKKSGFRLVNKNLEREATSVVFNFLNHVSNNAYLWKSYIFCSQIILFRHQL